MSISERELYKKVEKKVEVYTSIVNNVDIVDYIKNEIENRGIQCNIINHNREWLKIRFYKSYKKYSISDIESIINDLIQNYCTENNIENNFNFRLLVRIDQVSDYIYHIIIR